MRMRRLAKALHGCGSSWGAEPRPDAPPTRLIARAASQYSQTTGVSCFFGEILIQRSKLGTHRAGRAIADPAPVDLRDGGDAAQCAGHESLIRGIDFGQREVLFAHHLARAAPDLHDLAPGDAVEATCPGRGPQLSSAQDEEVRGIAACDKAAIIQHQCLIRAHVDGLDQRLNKIQPRMRVQAKVEHIRGRAADRRGHQPQPGFLGFRARLLIFGDDDDRRATHDKTRILIDRGFLPACDHQADVNAVQHVVMAQRAVDFPDQRGAIHADLKTDGIRALIKPVHMIVDRQQIATDQAR